MKMSLELDNKKYEGNVEWVAPTLDYPQLIRAGQKLIFAVPSSL